MSAYIEKGWLLERRYVLEAGHIDFSAHQRFGTMVLAGRGKHRHEFDAFIAELRKSIPTTSLQSAPPPPGTPARPDESDRSG